MLLLRCKWGGYLLRMVFEFLQSSPFAMKIIKLLAKCSYEIFLIQMLVIYVYPDGFINEQLLMGGIDNHLLLIFIQLTIKNIVVFTLSIYVGYYFNLFYIRILNKCKV